MTDTGTTADTASSKTPGNPRKRKAEELSDDSGDPAAAAKQEDVLALYLPAPVWGHVLDFMPYGDVRSALLVGKPIAVEAAKHVQTLNVMKAGEMHIPAARRFANAEVVKILCLLQGTGEMDEDEEDGIIEQYTISEEASHRIPSFIGSFPKLKRLFFGGVLHDNGEAFTMTYGNMHRCVGPDNHAEVFRNLVFSLFGAFKTGALRREVKLPGLAYSLQDARLCAESSHDLDTNPCHLCTNCIQYLPLEEIIYASAYKDPKYFCLNVDDIWRLLLERPGIKTDIKRISEKVLCQTVFVELQGRKVESESAVERLSQKWRFDSQSPMQGWVLPKSAFERLDNMMKGGLDSGQIRRRYFFERIGHLIGPRLHVMLDQSEFNVWSKSAVEGLAARGFPVDCDSIPVIDDRFFSKVDSYGPYDSSV